MKEIQALQESGLDQCNGDPFDQVMEKKNHPGRLRLYGRGVCNTDLKGKGIDKPQVLDPEFVGALKTGPGEDMQKDLDAHKHNMDVELQVEKEKVANMQKELDAQKVQLDAQRVELEKVADMQKEIDARKAKVDHVLLLLQMISGMMPEMIAQLAAASHVRTSDNPIISPTVASLK